MEFQSWGKIHRLLRECIVTEKIDGTNAQVAIFAEPETLDQAESLHMLESQRIGHIDGLHLFAGSRKRYLTPNDDNFGFARWVEEHADELVQLGPGRHYGEWWGKGVQRGYGLPEKRFSLFNVHKWDSGINSGAVALAGTVRPPGCVDVVPIAAKGAFDTAAITELVGRLSQVGSLAAPGFPRPEGIVVQHVPSRQLYKVTVDDVAGR